MSDAQLLDWFVSQRDEAAEAAFNELGFDMQTVNEEQASQSIERFLDQTIDGVLNPTRKPVQPGPGVRPIATKSR